MRGEGVLCRRKRREGKLLGWLFMRNSPNFPAIHSKIAEASSEQRRWRMLRLGGELSAFALDFAALVDEALVLFCDDPSLGLQKAALMLEYADLALKFVTCALELSTARLTPCGLEERRQP